MFLPYFARPHIMHIVIHTREIAMTDQYGGYGLPTAGDRLSALRTPTVTTTPTSSAERKLPNSAVLIAIMIGVVAVLFGVLNLKAHNKLNSAGMQSQNIDEIGTDTQKKAGLPVLLDGDVLFGVAVKPGNYPAGLKAGDIVQAVTTPSISGSGQARDIETRLTVTSVDTSSDIGGETIVTLSGPQSVTTAIAESGPVHLMIVQVGPK